MTGRTYLERGPLARLLEQATPGPWRVLGLDVCGANSQPILLYGPHGTLQTSSLAALAPDGLRLLADMAAKLAAGPCPGCGDDGWYVGHEDDCHETGDCVCSGVQIECGCSGEKAALLARFAELEARASAGAEQGAAQ